MTDSEIKVGDVVLDLAQGRPMHVLEEYDGDAAEWSEANGYDLVDNYGNGRLDASETDAVFECVYCSSIKSEPTKTYAFPEGRLARVETEAADGGRQVYDRVAVDVLEAVFDAMHRGAMFSENEIDALTHHTGLPEDLVDEARELADVEQQFGGDDA